MHTVGIICEYNPFHRGHAALFRAVRERFGEETAIVCAMSGNFVQRGDFAIVRKHVRAEAALRGGADLVLELPVPWAIASAEGFARGGVAMLEACGAVDTLAFGSECADAEKLMRVAQVLLSEEYRERLHGELAVGDSFAAARQRAAERMIGADAEVLSRPNDILGVEYGKAILSQGSVLHPLALPRVGAEHHGTVERGIASATEIRRLLTNGGAAEQYLTPEMAELYRAECAVGRAPTTLAAAERAVLAVLRSRSESELAAYDGGGEGLYHRVFSAIQTANGVDALLDAAKTKRYPMARLRRMLIAAYLGIAEPEGTPPYLHVLGCTERGRAVLHEMRTASRLPVLTKSADVRELSDEARRLFAQEARADDLYALAYPDLHQSGGGSAWTTDPVIL